MGNIILSNLFIYKIFSEYKYKILNFISFNRHTEQDLTISNSENE